MPQRNPVVDELIRSVEAVASNHPDMLSALIIIMTLTIESETDPYLLAGSLVEGIAVTIAHRIPTERQGEVSVETVRILRDRLRSYGAI